MFGLQCFLVINFVLSTSIKILPHLGFQWTGIHSSAPEGIDSTASESFDDHQIFTLTVLLASVLIYNSQGVPTRNDVEKLEYPFSYIQFYASSTDPNQPKA